ncbi:nitrate reductase gamma subunit [Mycobacterium kansasii 732]|nr:nitrate reductase gamma subunit [Mycobacterium kansasii 732]
MNSALWMTMPYIAFTSFVLGTSGVIAPISSVGPLGHRRSTSAGCCGWAARCSTSGSSCVFVVTWLVCWSPSHGHRRWNLRVRLPFDVGDLGLAGGFAVVTGLGILLYRRITVPAVRRVTTRNDKLMYLLLVAALLTGMVNTLTNVVATYNYRDTVSPWFRSLFSLHPAPELMASAPPTFQVHAVIVLALLGIWPYTRLVHMFSAPVGYLLRPHVIYRSPDLKRPGSHRYSKAWVAPEAPPVRSKWV